MTTSHDVLGSYGKELERNAAEWSERQKARDKVEYWRVKSINWVLDYEGKLPAHGLPNCLRGISAVEFQRHEVKPSMMGTFRVGAPLSSNRERLGEILQSIGMVSGGVHDREHRVDQMVRSWNEDWHEKLCSFIAGEKVDLDRLVSVVTTRDDGIDLQEVLVAVNSAAGSW